MTTEARYRAENVLIAGIGLILILSFLVGVAYLATQMYCFRSGKCPSLLMLGDASVTPIDYFNDNAPSLNDEFAQYDPPTEHPIPQDLGERVRGKFQQAPEIFNIIEYRGYVFIDLKASDGNYHLAVYRWNGNNWVFVTLFCETCK